MKVYDIAQEVFSCIVFPGDPCPEKEQVLSIDRGDACNLTKFSMCAHNGTHIDAPRHFYKDGKAVDQVSMERLAGYCLVAEHEGKVTGPDMAKILQQMNAGDKPVKMVLIKGKAELTSEAAQLLADAHVLLYGNESQTVGPEDAPREVHLILLGAEIVILEGIRLGHVPEGIYLLNAAPINLGGCDGAPCRPTLIPVDELR